VSLVQVGVLKIPAVRDFCKIERLITHDPNSLPRKNKGFVKGFKECKYPNPQIISYNVLPFITKVKP
jgi:hypothetical protein